MNYKCFLSRASLSALALMMGGEAFAQSSGEDIVVTGSRIRGVAPVGSDVVAITREDVVSSGATSTADLLKQVPQITVLGFNEEGSLGPAAPSNITRSTAPNIRGIGPTATLTVFDGQRVSAGGTMGQLVDPSILPPLALERVEVIADGASAIYGSDAVAGVVNLIPRKNFRGLEVSARGGYTEGSHDYQVGAVAGTTWNSGHITFAVDHTFTGELATSERSFVTDDRSVFGGQGLTATNCAAPGTLTVRTGTGPSQVNEIYRLPNGAGTGFTYAGLQQYRDASGLGNVCDAQKFNNLRPESTRNSAFGYIDQDITSNLKVYLEGNYSTRDFQTSRTPPFLNGVTVPATNPFRPTGLPAGATTLVSRSFTPELGNGSSVGTSESWLVIGGIDASIGQFNAKLAATYGEGSDFEDRVIINTTEQAALLADTNPATALNLFGGPNTNNPASLARLLSGKNLIQGGTQLQGYNLTVDGPIFAIPGGDVRLAVGAEYREELLTGYSRSTATGVPAINASRADRSTRAAYAELFVPVVSAENAVPLIQELSLSVAGRHENYSDFGSTTNPKVGVSWAPIGGLKFRGSYGKSFRAPGLSENDPNASGAAITVTTNPTIAGVVRTGFTQANIRGGNAALVPETAQTWSTGFEIEPGSVPGLRFSTTYFNIRYKNQIIDGFSRTGLYQLSPSLYPDQIGFNPASGVSINPATFARLLPVVRSSTLVPNTPINYSDPNLILVDTRRVNLGGVRTNGVDFDLRYRFTTDAGDTFSFGANASLMLQYNVQDTGTGPFVDRLNRISYPSDFTGRANFGWERGKFGSQISASYTNAYLNDLSTLVQAVDAYTTFDLDLSYTLGERQTGARLGFNVRNVFDTPPPQVDRGGAYDPSKASAIGRVMAVSLSKRW